MGILQSQLSVIIRYSKKTVPAGSCNPFMVRLSFAALFNVPFQISVILSVVFFCSIPLAQSVQQLNLCLGLSDSCYCRQEHIADCTSQMTLEAVAKTT